MHYLLEWLDGMLVHEDPTPAISEHVCQIPMLLCMEKNSTETQYGAANPMRSNTKARIIKTRARI